MEHIQLGDIEIEVELKDIKNVHLSVYPPKGRVRIAAPSRMSMDTIRIYALTKLPWIKKQQLKFHSQVRETPREFLHKESHYFLGKRYLLNIIEADTPPKVHIRHKTMELTIRPNTGLEKRQSILDEWYRAQLKVLVPPIIAKWERQIHVKVEEFGIKKMKTKWGTCNPLDKRIWLNLELAKKPYSCIEYIVVHEMIHLLEPNHNAKFIAYIDNYMPEWRQFRHELNQLPVSHREWGY